MRRFIQNLSASLLFSFPRTLRPHQRLIALAGLIPALWFALNGGPDMAPAHAASSPTISPITPPAQINTAMAELGKKLFFDPRLSRSGLISCNTCHNLSRGGVDNLPVSIGHGWQTGRMNAPTVLNASLHRAQFWDGRAATLAEQAKLPLINPVEMASTHAEIVRTLQTIPGYVAEFRQVFGDQPIHIDRVAEAIASFESTLVTPDSRFDQWLRGNQHALTSEELAGYQLFQDRGCMDCHKGPALGGQSFEELGIYAPYHSKNPSQGRFDVTGNPKDRMKFKVPSLRNIALTAPYFHDGAVQTLREAVDLMGRLQLDVEFTPQENARMVAFLHTLTGEQPRIVLPQLPPSADNTPTPRLH